MLMAAADKQNTKQCLHPRRASVIAPLLPARAFDRDNHVGVLSASAPAYESTLTFKFGTVCTCSSCPDRLWTTGRETPNEHCRARCNSSRSWEAFPAAETTVRVVDPSKPVFFQPGCPLPPTAWFALISLVCLLSALLFSIAHIDAEFPTIRAIMKVTAPSESSAAFRKTFFNLSCSNDNRTVG